MLDFGIAKILQGSDIDSSDLTQAGQMIGTLDYMSPEQMVGGLWLWSIGVVDLLDMTASAAGRRSGLRARIAVAKLRGLVEGTAMGLARRW